MWWKRCGRCWRREWPVGDGRSRGDEGAGDAERPRVRLRTRMRERERARARELRAWEPRVADAERDADGDAVREAERGVEEERERDGLRERGAARGGGCGWVKRWGMRRTDPEPEAEAVPLPEWRRSGKRLWWWAGGRGTCTELVGDVGESVAVSESGGSASE